MRALERFVFLAVSILLLVSVFVGPEGLARVGLGFLGRWGAPALWGGFLIARSVRGCSCRHWARRWRPELLLALILGFSLCLRWPMGELDLQHYIGPDEGEMVENGLAMLKAGDFNQRHPGYPGLFFYIQMVPATAHHLLTAARGEGSTIPEQSREGFYRVARRTTLLAGWLAAIACYLAGRRRYGRPAAALAAALVGLSPLVFRESKVVNPDLMLMLFVTIGLGLCLRVLDEPKRARFLLAGAAVGLATAIKYTGVVLAVPYMVAWLVCGEARRNFGHACLGLVVALVTFMAVSPYSWLDLPAFLRGITMHFGYYQAADVNAPGDLTRYITSWGLGVPAAVAAFVGSVWALSKLETPGLVVLSFPMAYLLMFSFFQRAYPRHAVVLLPFLALLAARAVTGWLESPNRFRWLPYATVVLLLAAPIYGSSQLGLAARRPTPAMRAAEWIDINLPAGSRILEDQYTPRLDSRKHRVHRLRVEEKVFAGNYDWVLHSGYPPGLPLKGLRSVLSFSRGESLGTKITLYEVPERDTLMNVTLDLDQTLVVLGAGELPYFGEGWHPPSAEAFETSRLSDGATSEIFFVLAKPGADPFANLVVNLSASGVASREEVVEVEGELNGNRLSTFELRGDEPEEYHFVFPGDWLREGLNRFVLRYGETLRLNRRHRNAALRFYHMELGWER